MNIININAKNKAEADKAIELISLAHGYQSTIQTEEGEVANPQSAYDFVNEKFLHYANEYINEGNNLKLTKIAKEAQPESDKIKLVKEK